MDLEKLTGKGIEQAFTLLGNTVALGTYTVTTVSGDLSGYDPETDELAAGTDILNVRMIMVAASSEELIGTDVTVDDVKFLIPGKDLGGVVPKTTHEITCRGIVYDVIKIKPLPVDSLRIVFGRAK